MEYILLAIGYAGLLLELMLGSLTLIVFQRLVACVHAITCCNLSVFFAIGMPSYCSCICMHDPYSTMYTHVHGKSSLF